jgi:hypothetical protein
MRSIGRIGARSADSRRTSEFGRRLDGEGYLFDDVGPANAALIAAKPASASRLSRGAFFITQPTNYFSLCERAHNQSASSVTMFD